jgi:hypothetical protein
VRGRGFRLSFDEHRDHANSSLLAFGGGGILGSVGRVGSHLVANVSCAGHDVMVSH